MARATASKGECAYCGQEVAKGGVTKHLAACVERKVAFEKAEANKATVAEPLFHLRVQDANRREFWLDLEARGSAKLKDLDGYLRAIWLECCGHLSQFSASAWGEQKFAVKRLIGEVLEP